MLVNISMTFHEDILYCFQSYRADGIVFCSHSQSLVGITQNIYIQELWFLRSARRLMFVSISIMFHEDILNGFQVTELQSWRHCILFLAFFMNDLTPTGRPGAVARSKASSLGMQAAPSSIPMSCTFFRGDLVMKTFLRPFSLFRWFKKCSCQLLAKECALSSGKLPRRLAQEQCG